MSKRKIVFINVAYYPTVGGTQRVVQMIAEKCVSYGFDVYVFCLLPKNREIHEYNGVKIFEITTLKSLFKELALLNPDIVYCNIVHNLLTIKISLYHYFFRPRKNYVLILNSVGGYGKGSIFRALYQFLFSGEKKYIFPKIFRVALLKIINSVFDYYIVMDNKGTDYLFDRKYISKDKIIFIPQGLDFAELDEIKEINFDNIRKKYGITSEPYFVCAHNFQVWKNHKELIEFFKENIDLNLVILGSKTLSHPEVLRSLEKAKNSKNIHIVTDIPRKEFLAIINNSIGHLSFSKVEGHQNNVLIECMYMNKLYITSPATQDYSYFPNVVIFRNHRELLQIINNLHRYNSALDTKGSEYCIKNKMSWEDVMNKYFELFENVK